MRLKYVLSNIDKLTIRRAYRSEDEPPYQPRVMSGEAKARLIERIKAAPGMYIGQEQVNRSTAPVWEQGQLQAWSLALRLPGCQRRHVRNTAGIVSSRLARSRRTAP
ncbi:MAG: circularly permuted type 2 ATP-grasp protein [Pirellulaceae bacterium]